MPLLLMQHADGKQETIAFDQDRFVIGRRSTCDLHQVFSEDSGVSRVHACIIRRGDAYQLEDLGSRNGTACNGKLVVKAVTLQHGDKLRLANVEFQYYDDEVTVDAQPPRPRGSYSGSDDSYAKVPVHATVSLTESSLQRAFSAEDAALKLNALVQLLANTGESLEVKGIYRQLLIGLLEVFPKAKHGFVAVLNEQGDVQLQAVESRSGNADQKIRVSQTVISSVMESRRAVLSSNAATDDRFNASGSTQEGDLRSIMCVPLLLRSGEAIGVIQLESREFSNRFGPADLEILASITPHVAMSLEYARIHAEEVTRTALQQDLEYARQIQRNFLPRQAPEVRGLDFFSFYEAAHQVGGDHFDYFTLSGGRVGVVVSDVAGKGIAASLLMSKFAAEFKYVLSRDESLSSTLAHINDSFSTDAGMMPFITVAAVVIDVENQTVSVVNAGHTPVLLRSSDGQVTKIGEDAKGMPIGIMADQKYETTLLPLRHGDTLVMYTDGLNEATASDGSTFGYDRVIRCVERADSNVGNIGKSLLDEVQSFVGREPQSDDMCLVCVGCVAISQ